MKIGKALDKFQTQLEADGRSIHTIQQNVRHLRLLAHWLRDVGHSGDVKRISHQDIARFLVAPRARSRPDGAVKKPTSMNALRSSLKGFFGYLYEAGIVARNPTRLIRMAICGSPPPRALSEGETKRLMNAMATAEGPEACRDHALFHLMLATGIRLGSAVGLDLEDVDLDGGRIQLRRTKGNHPEWVFLGKDIKRHLQQYIGDRTVGPLFTARHSERLSHRQVQRRFSQWLKNADINRPASPHTLRSTFATRLYRQTSDIFLVKEALRHRSIVSTLVYAQVDEGRLRRALQV